MSAALHHLGYLAIAIYLLLKAGIGFFFTWFVKDIHADTRTAWWNDSIELGELDRSIRQGAVGASSNPFLAHVALSHNRRIWSDEIEPVMAELLLRLSLFCVSMPLLHSSALRCWSVSWRRGP